MRRSTPESSSTPAAARPDADPVAPNHAYVILLTPPGAAALAVVRIGGPRVSEFLRAHFQGTPARSCPVHGTLVDSDDVIDDPVIVLAPDASFADISLHGGAWVVRAALDLARREGFEIEEGDAGVAATVAIDADGEIEREILSHLPLATTELALRSLLAQRRAWDGLLKGFVNPAEVRRILADRSLHWLLHPPRVAIVGAANVGKSTLANQLFAQERSITADIPGTTRDWVGEIANLNGLAVQLVDTPGLRGTDDPIEAIAIERSAEQIRGADLVVLVLDASRLLEPDQSPLLQRFGAAIRVVNKHDLTHRWDVAPLDGIEMVATSGQGVDRLIDQILVKFDNPQRDSDRARCWTPRQREILSRAITGRNPES